MTQSRAHILVVNDDRNIRKNLTMALEAVGYTVDATGDGEEALANVDQRTYDIAFVDIQTPKIGGHELIRYIRDLCKEATVVMLSQYGTMAMVVEAMRLGAVDFIEKPFDSKKIHLLCEEILQRQQLTANQSVNELLRLAELALQSVTPIQRYGCISKWRCCAMEVAPSPTIG